jgi:hypothetical protein
MPQSFVRLEIADAEADAESGKLDRAFAAACQQLSFASAIHSCEEDSDAKQFLDNSYYFDGANLSSFLFLLSRIADRRMWTKHRGRMSLIAENLAEK